MTHTENNGSTLPVDCKFDLGVSRLYRKNHAGREHLYVFYSALDGSQYRPLYRLTKRHVRTGDRVLDWGVGSGHFSLFLRSLPVETHGFSLDDRLSVDLQNDVDYQFKTGDDPVLLPIRTNISMRPSPSGAGACP
jgi:hypothetical protein